MVNAMIWYGKVARLMHPGIFTKRKTCFWLAGQNNRYSHLEPRAVGNVVLEKKMIGRHFKVFSWSRLYKRPCYVNVTAIFAWHVLHRSMTDNIAVWYPVESVISDFGSMLNRSLFNKMRENPIRGPLRTYNVAPVFILESNWNWQRPGSRLIWLQSPISMLPNNFVKYTLILQNKFGNDVQ